MKPEYVSLFSGFVGAVLGAGASIATVWIQQRAQEKRDRARLAIDAAVKEFEAAEKYAEFTAKHGGRLITRDLAYYILLHTRLSDHLLSGRDITKEQWTAAHKQAKDISEAGNDVYAREKREERGEDN